MIFQCNFTWTSLVGYGWPVGQYVWVETQPSEGYSAAETEHAARGESVWCSVFRRFHELNPIIRLKFLQTQYSWSIVLQETCFMWKRHYALH